MITAFILCYIYLDFYKGMKRALSRKLGKVPKTKCVKYPANIHNHPLYVLLECRVWVFSIYFRFIGTEILYALREALNLF